MQNTPPLRDLADLYVLRCEVEGKSPKTVSAYRGTLTRFLRAVPVEHASDVGQEGIYAYLGGCRGLATESRHRYFREVRCFFNWLVDAGYIEKTPFRGMKNVRLPSASSSRSPRRKSRASSTPAGTARSGCATGRSSCCSSTPGTVFGGHPIDPCRGGC